MESLAAKEKPIIFTAGSITGILNSNKTMTRRVIKPQPVAGVRWSAVVVGDYGGWTDGHGTALRCPYEVGMRLWVREAMKEDADGVWCYVADGEWVDCDRADESAMMSWVFHKDASFCSPLHMPRWASRITLEVTEIRAEQVQDISDRDCVLEGCCIQSKLPGDEEYSFRGGYRALWDSINAKRGFAWESNPWVFAISFKEQP